MIDNKMSLTDVLESRHTALTVKEVAELLAVSDDTVYKMAAALQIPYIRARGSVRFDPGDVAAWIKKQRPQPLERRGPGRPKRD